jgi:hypothetical protein
MAGLSLLDPNKQPGGYCPQGVSGGARAGAGQSFGIGARLVELTRLAARVDGVEGINSARAIGRGAGMADFCRFLLPWAMAVAGLIVARWVVMGQFCEFLGISRLMVNLHGRGARAGSVAAMPPQTLPESTATCGGGAPLSRVSAHPIPLRQRAAGFGKSFGRAVRVLFRLIADGRRETWSRENGVGGLGVARRAERAEKSARNSGPGRGVVLRLRQGVEPVLRAKGRAKLGGAHCVVN